MKPCVSLLIFLLCIHSLGLASAARCHVDDEQGLLGFKSGITHDPSGMLASWKPTTHCCKWAGVKCYPDRVNYLILKGSPDRPNAYLSGTISPSLSKLQHLTLLQLEDLRNLSGTFPDVLFGLPRLWFLSLHNNDFSGPLPHHLGNLSQQLEYMNLDGNRFHGSIPDSVSKLAHLGGLSLARNLLTGTIPEAIGHLSKLYSLDLSHNHLSGTIPNFSSALTMFHTLDLSHNKLSGSIPTSVADLRDVMSTFKVGHNDLTGGIPSFFGDFVQLARLDLSWNHFHGKVPKSFENITQSFGDLDLSHNNLEGPFPRLNTTKVYNIDLSYNKFELGVIPEWITLADSLGSVRLAKCGIKMNLEDWKPLDTAFLNTVDISENEVSGSPVTLFNATFRLKEFRAAGNKLKFNMGRIKLPKYMETLDVSRNLAYGYVPRSVAKLKSLNVSHNHLCGQTPTTKFTASAFLGNDCLCGSPLPPCKV